MHSNIVEENMEFGRYPYSGFYIISILIILIMSWVTRPGKCLSPKIRYFAITLYHKAQTLLENGGRGLLGARACRCHS